MTLLPFFTPRAAAAFQDADALFPILGGLCCLLLLGALGVIVVVLVLRSGGKQRSAAPRAGRGGGAGGPHSSMLNRPGLRSDPPPATARWLVAVIAGKDSGRQYPVSASLSIGRAPDNEIQLQDGLVSRQHAQIEPDEDACYVADLESGNGTFVNGRRISESTWLQAGDEIQVGDTVLQLIAGAAQPAPAAPPAARPSPPAPMPAGPPAPYPPPPQASYGPPPAQGYAGATAEAEPVLAVLPMLERRKGLFGSQAYNLVMTPHRLVFAAVTSQMLQAASRQAKEAAKAEGKGFFGQWGAMFDANGKICEQYFAMPISAILAGNSDNFAIPLNQVRKVEVKRNWMGAGDDDQPDPDQVIIHAGSKHTFNLKGVNAAQAKKILRSALGDLVR